MSDDLSSKAAYLGMIQGVINRLASTSATFKGFAVTLFAGVLAVIFSVGGENRVPVLVLAGAADLVIAGFDCWYFFLEKRYRKLYDRVRCGNHSVDFEMKNDKSIEVKLSEVFSSKAIWLYYLLIAAGYIVAVLLCVMGPLGF